MAGVKIVDLPALGRDLINTDLLEVSLNGGGSRKITGQEIMNASKLAIGSTPIVSGTVGRLLFQGAGNVLSQPSSLFYDAVNNRLGIGTTTPGASLDVVYESTFQSRIDMYGTLYMYNNITSLSGNIWLNNGYAIGDWGTGNNRIEFYSNRLSFFGNGNEALRIVGSTGNLLVNTVTDAGYKFDVNGTARVQNTLTVTKGAGNFFTFDAAPNGSDLSIRFYKLGQIDVSLFTRNGVSIGALLIPDGLGVNGGFVATRLGATSGVIAVGNTGGDALCHIASPNGFSTYVQFRENGVSERGLLGFQNGTSYLQIRTNGATNMSNGTFSTAFFSTGNVGINTTTDAGFKLDVNGTARVSGAATLAGTNTLSGTTNVSGLSSNWICQYPSNATVKPLSFSAQSGGATSNNVAIQFGFNFRESGGLFTQDIFQNILYDNTTNNVVTGFEWYTHQTQAGSNPSVLAMALRGKTLSIGTNTPNASAVLQADSTTQGFLPPRMTNAQRAAIASPAVGLIVYCTDATEGLYVYKSTGWTFIV